MNFNDAVKQVSRLKNVLDHNIPEIAFTYKPVFRDELFKVSFRKEVPVERGANNSGVYFILSKNDDILYIGKATNDNIGKEIWSKLGSPEIIKENDIPRFSKSDLAQWAPNEHLRQIIIQGDFKIAAILVSPKEISSLPEVYLQTWCTRLEALPPLNKRIG